MARPRTEPPTFKCPHCGKVNERRRLIWRGRSIGFDKRQFCDKECANDAQLAGGSIHHTGYRYIRVDRRPIAEHRHVMQQKLKRKLQKYEWVHHKNGDRLDNRIQNLELWVTRKDPKGQRESDTIDWCVQFLETRGFTVARPLARR